MGQAFGDGRLPAAAVGLVPAAAARPAGAGRGYRQFRQPARLRSRSRGRVNLRLVAALLALCAIGWWYSPVSPRVPKPPADRKRVLLGKSVPVTVDLCARRILSHILN